MSKKTALLLSTLVYLACSPLKRPQADLNADVLTGDLSKFDLGGRKVFLNGVNVAWNKFGRDFGDFKPEIDGYDGSYFENTFATINEAGGNSVRIWMHTSGEFNPKFDKDGFYICKDESFFNDIKDLLDRAKRHHLVVIFSLWSFDMMDSTKNPNIFGDKILHRNRLLLTSKQYLDAYINNCYKRILTTVKDHPAMFAMELINEPEWMTDLKKWDKIQKIPLQDLQRFVGTLASVTHDMAPKIKVTVGSVDTAFLNVFDDSVLIKESGKKNGTLDFFQTHYYDEGINPFHTDARKFTRSKPMIIGEFPANEANLSELYENAFNRGYAGVFVWKFKETPEDFFGSWKDGKIAKALSSLAEKHPDAIKLKDYRVGQKKY